MTASDAIPAAAAGSSEAATRLWNSVMEAYELEQHELVLLVQACRTVSTLDALDAEVQRDGAVVATAGGGKKASPAAIESRQQSVALARIIAALRLPAGAAGDQQLGARPQRRSAPRGVYGLVK